MAVKKVVQKSCKKTGFFLRNHRGIAVAEMLPLLAIFIMLFGLIFGFWQSIHSGILQSIAARHYAFEVINNRTHFVYHRDTVEASGPTHYYRKNGHRFFAVVELQSLSKLELVPKEKEINLFNKNQLSIPAVRDSNKVNPIWIKTGYGICIDFECGGKVP